MPSVDIPRYFRLFREGKIKLRELVSERYPLDDINTAINDMIGGVQGGRCLVAM